MTVAVGPGAIEGGGEVVSVDVTVNEGFGVTEGGTAVAVTTAVKLVSVSAPSFPRTSD